MSILIHGVSMPKDGKVLLIDPWGNVRLYWSKDVVAVGTGLYLCKASELPPHGRLGDLDALLVKLKKDPLFPLVETYGMSGVIEAQPTIIPEDSKKEGT